MPSGMDMDNAVNIRGSDHRMRYGRIVDLAENGLFVDLLCPHRRREFAPFGSVFPNRSMSSEDLERSLAKQLPTVPVQILVLETSSGPWIWVPGKMRRSCVHRGRPAAWHGPPTWCGGAVVHWQSPDTGELCTDILPMQRIRTSDKVVCDPTDPDVFSRRSVDLGAKFRSMSPNEARSLVQRLTGYSLQFYSPIFIVNLERGVLSYFHRCRHQEKGYQRMSFGREVDRFHKGLIRMVTDNFTSTGRADDDSLPQFTFTLPVELWEEVFSHLNTLNQTKLRMVCVTWNRILNAPALRSTLVVRYENDANWSPARFLALATVYKCLRSGTQHVIITHADDNQLTTFDALMVCDMIQYVARHLNALHLHTVHLHRVRLNLQMGCGVGSTHSAKCREYEPDAKTEDYCWLGEFFAACRRLPCDVVPVTNCNVSVMCSFCIQLEHGQPWEFFQAEISISNGSMRSPTGGGFCCTFWDALEAALPMPPEAELRRLSQRLTVGGDLHEQEEVRNAVGKILCTVQSRTSLHSRGDLVCVDGWEHLQWDRFSRLTLHFLLNLRRWNREKEYHPL